MQLIFASQNENKAKEIKNILGNGFEILSLNELGFHDELSETQNTFEGNALEKARFISKFFKADCFAEDSGLEVEALNGEPGVFSARYAGEGKKSSDNNVKLLDEMKDKTNRRAQFRTVIALIIDGKEFLFEGIVSGEIAYVLTGEKGFGYDPLFKPDGYSKSFGELGTEVKNKISHRAEAVMKMKEFLLQK